ncbi:MAG: hypothetical protein Q8N47_01195 [Bryobacterales bacterium]|nr:hypothetical protein [Bryobacterales bacterium]
MPKPRLTSDLRREYKFDYAKARPNRFAGRPVPEPVAVVPAPDVAKVTTAPPGNGDSNK